MKKISKFAVILSALTCAVCMTACGNSGDNSQQSSVTVSEVISQAEDSEEESSLTDTSLTEISPAEVSEEISDPSQVSSVEQLFSMPKAKENLEQIAENMSNDTQTTRIFAEDDKTVVFEVTLIGSINEDEIEEAVSYLASYTELSKDVFVQAAASLEELPNLDGVIISVRYNNTDGTLLYKSDFTSDMADNDESSTELSEELDTEFSTEFSTEPSLSTPKIYSSLQEYLDSPTVSSTFEQMIEMYTTDSMTMDVYVEDETKLVYEYQLMIDADEETAELLKESLDSYESIILSDMTAIKSLVDDDNISIILRYIDQNYDTIYEKEYTD